ncbi:MAG: hypothetical protein K9N09_03620 [Candidatus Cloacimonetes bacterium]|nr:hypothetical protein [Candidatus Cloacimonadota bacterium]MCF7814567.1 hypothetical protein [Candidatus Cloacimonadota bacterium]MCF7867767.1 hypothetical protein [Candidatus Cloacimonadota bacterium]MCF7883255.1 hypothetical protein [Candidatus Cloacimonadota bacterium]
MLIDYLSHDLIYQKKENWTDEKYDFERDWGWFIDSSHLKNNISVLELGCGTACKLFLLVSESSEKFLINIR